MSLNLDAGVDFDDHARQRMRMRRISEVQVVSALRDHHTAYPAAPRHGEPSKTMIYVGTVDERELKIYVLTGVSPTYVLTVAWKEEDE
jgi:hypothetical protein